MKLTPGERFGSALSKAFDELRAADILLTASNSGSSVADNRLTVAVLNRNAVVDLGAGTVTWDDGTEPDCALKVVLLHYLQG